jgi:hypothetical protein
MVSLTAAGLADGVVSVTLYADGPDRQAAIAALADSTRELYASIIGVVDTVEEVARTYYGVTDSVSDE